MGVSLSRIARNGFQIGVGLRRAVATVILANTFLMSPLAMAISNPAVRNPMASSTLPPTSYQGGLITRSDPTGTSGNLIVTGNVGAGKHFRAPVPYTSTSTFAAPLGSSSLDSFLRISAPPTDVSGYSTATQPFYSPTGTVAATGPGTAGVFVPSSPRIVAYAPSLRIDPTNAGMLVAPSSSAQLPAGLNSTGIVDDRINPAQRLGYAPLSRSVGEMDALISHELGAQLVPAKFRDSQASERMVQEYDATIERIRDKIEGDDGRIDPAQAEPDASSPLGQDAQPAPVQGQSSVLDALRQPQNAVQAQTQDSVRQDAPDRSLPQINDPTAGNPAESVEKRLLPSPLEAGDSAEAFLPDDEGQDVQPSPALARVLEAVRTAGTDAAGDLQQPGRQADSPDETIAPNRESVQSALERFQRRYARPGGGVPTGPPKPSMLASEAADPTESGQGESVGPKSFTQERFDRYVRAAELYLAQGKYYRASDAFALASLYKPRDAGVHLGRSKALLAAGDYLSSAVILAQALEMDPRCVAIRVNLVAALGGLDAFQERIADLEQWSAKNKAPHFQFLLAYVYYQTDRFSEAKRAIEAAQSVLTRSLAVGFLRDAIEDRR